MTWITNHPRTYKGLIPRRIGVEYFDGEPKATDEYSIEQMKEAGLVGVYVNISKEEYYKLPLGNPNKK